MFRAWTQLSFSLSSLCTVVVCGSSTWQASSLSRVPANSPAGQGTSSRCLNLRCFSSKEFGGPSCSFCRQLQNTSEGTQSSAQQFISSWGHHPISFICIAHGCRVGVHTHLICKIKLGDVFEHMHEFIPGVKIECEVKFNFTLAALKAQETFFFHLLWHGHAWILAFLTVCLCYTLLVGKGHATHFCTPHSSSDVWIETWRCEDDDLLILWGATLAINTIHFHVFNRFMLCSMFCYFGNNIQCHRAKQINFPFYIPTFYSERL